MSNFSDTMKFVNNNFTSILLIVIALGIGFFGGSLYTENNILKNGGNPQVQGADTNTAPSADPIDVSQTPELSEDDHVRGNLDAKVVLVEYSDFECPYCAAAHANLEEVLANYDQSQVAWVYRHYPLSFHPHALDAAVGSECVANQAGNDAFWAYADSLAEYNRANGELSDEAIQEAATKAGVDLTEFNNCLENGDYAQEVTQELSGGSKAGVSGTPATIVFVDGKPQEMISGALPAAQFEAVIDSYLQ